MRMPADPAVKPRRSDRARAAIQTAAAELFAAHGYEGASVRDIAERAKIDPSMVIRYFGSKDALFAATATFDLALPDVASIPRARIGETLVAHFLRVWSSGENNGLQVLLRSAPSNEFAADRIRAVFATQVLPTLVAFAGADAPRRAGLVASQMLGLALCRYIVKIPPLVMLSDEEVVAAIGPTLQRYIAGEL